MSYKCDNCGTDKDNYFLCSDCVTEKEEKALEEGRKEGKEEAGRSNEE